MKLIEVYKSILSYCGMKADDSGKISLLLGGISRDIKEDGKTVYLPLPEVLKHFDPATMMIFHPFLEHYNRGESKIVKMLRKTLSIRLNHSLVILIDNLLEVLGSAELHRKFTPEQRDFLISARTANPDHRLKLTEELISKYFKDHPSSAVVSLYLKKSGTYRGERHLRVGVSSFPIYDFLTKNRPATLSKAAAETALEIVKYVLPGSEVENGEGYNGFSDHSDIPWLDCLLNTGYQISGRLEELYTLFGDYLGEQAERHFDHAWLDEIGNLAKYRREIALIPDQSGNSGELDKPVPQPAAPQTAASIASNISLETAPVAQPGIREYNTKPMPAQPVQQPTAQTHITSSGEIDFSKAQNPATMMAGMMSTPLTQAVDQKNMMDAYAKLMQNPAAMMNHMAMNNYQANPMMAQMLQQQMMQNPQMAGGMVNMNVMPIGNGGMMQQQLTPQQQMMMFAQQQQMQQQMQRQMGAGIGQMPGMSFGAGIMSV